MKKILYVLSNEPTGGVGTVVLNYTSRFSDQLTVDYLIYTSERDTAFQHSIQRTNNRIYYLPDLKVRNYREIRKMTDDFFKAHAKDYCAVHLHFAGIANLIMPFAFKYGIPHRIVHSHNTKLSDNPLKNIRNKLLFTRGRKWINHYFACSAEAGRYLFGKKAVDQDQVYYVHNAVDCDVYSFNEAVRDRVRTEMNLKDKMVILSIGRMEPQKNLFFALDIFREVLESKPDAVYLIAGNGPDRIALEEKAKAEGINENVRFLGFTDRIPEILQAADVLLMPSLYEGLPLTAIEAQCSGLPCVLSDTITEETKMTDLIHFMSLKDDKYVWAEKCISVICRERKSYDDALTGNGYNIAVEARKLEKTYLNMGVLDE